MQQAAPTIRSTRLLIAKCLFVLSAAFMGITAAASRGSAFTGTCRETGYLIGAAQDDITGPIVGVGMMGYAEFSQVDEGIHMRLRARSLVVSDKCGEATVALVVGDLGMVFHGLKQAVLDQLDKDLPGVFNHANLIFSATHSHSGPGGYAYYPLYNITTLGFSPENFAAITRGTAASVVKAYRQRQAAELSFKSGMLDGYQFNRSPEALAADPEIERDALGGESDREMQLLKVVSDKGHALAAFNWYPVHGVSLPITNKLVSGDNKGLAAYLFERKMGATYRQDGEFVAGFFQANSGDISSYDVTHGTPIKTDGFARNEWSARGQFGKAYELFEAKDGDEIAGPISYEQRFEDLAYRPVSREFTGGAGVARMCNGVLGVSFAAGTLNGSPFPIFPSHSVYGKTWPEITLMPEEQKCHQEKVLLLPTGFVQPTPWTARIVPFQMVRIGPLVILAAPFEITTVAGHRLKAEILRRMAADGVRHVVLTGLANEYLHYVTTREEYAVQAYEGGATLYGPWSLAAYTEIFANLGEDIVTGRQRPKGAPPPDLSQQQIVLPHDVLFDLPPTGGKFGDVKTPARASYHVGEEATVAFWGAHPNNSAAPNSSYFTIDRWQKGAWQTQFFDWDGKATMRWQRDGLASSVLTINWHIDAEAVPGLYRVCQQGQAKAPFTGQLQPYRGCSQSFKVGTAP